MPGFSKESAARMGEVLTAHVEKRALPGLVALVARRGQVHVEVIGAKAFDDAEPMSRDAIFRIASLTKPIAGVAAMSLVEDGTLELQAPVDDWLPELADRRVLKRLDAELDETVPATRSITLDDLLTFRLGFGCIMDSPGNYPIQRAEAELQLVTLGPPLPPTPHTPDEWVRRLGTLPLMHQPGEKWMYNTGAQVLGVLLERAAGKPLEDLLRERIFEPLGMGDTGFSVAPSQRHRLTTAYEPDVETGDLRVSDSPAHSYWSQPPAFPNASAWLVSTIDDFWAFVSMILGKGMAGGQRILAESSVELMTTDQLTPEQRDGNAIFFGEDGGWGLGMRVPAAGVEASGVPGGFGWDGGTGTTWRSDIERDVTGIVFTQRGLTSPEPPELFVDFWKCAYAAVDN